METSVFATYDENGVLKKKQEVHETGKEQRDMRKRSRVEGGNGDKEENGPHKKVKYECVVQGCKKVYSCKQHLDRHYELCHKICRACLFSFDTFLQLQKHIYFAHKRKKIYQLFCEFCGEEFCSDYSVNSLQKHLERSHSYQVSAEEITLNYWKSLKETIEEIEETTPLQGNKVASEVPTFVKASHCVCSSCGGSFATDKLFAMHVRREHFSEQWE